MNGPARQYLEVTQAVEAILDAPSADNDQNRKAYQIVRATLLRVRATHGAEHAASMAYQIGDELAVDGRR